ncbi:hypothetical protein BXU11_08295 [Flavobacterium sp. LM5]|uniref:hypothetical protein n=1 Tax=Flavobacterium sp. LM5 TaxID=1938610 RepID=UPI00099484BD|nr:hypothetical protein [Flavobacterium sp. LM5]OOV29850.1 hypothetical protein BXU11_08295 [Flavobacterium sp. LM5]
MNNKDFEKQILEERSFYENFDEQTFGKYYYLLGHSITTFKTIAQWENEILPYLDSLRNRTGKITDWNSFPWRGTICFRHDHVMVLDESIEQIGRRLPGLKKDNGENILNEDGDWLLDTLFIENNYTEYVKISLEKYITYCSQWIDMLQRKSPQI